MSSVCGVFGMPEAAARFRQTERYYFWILEQFILQNVRVKAQSGFRVTIVCYKRSSEPTLLRMLTLSQNNWRQLSEYYQNEFIASHAYELNKAGSERNYDSFNPMLDISSDSFTKNLKPGSHNNVLKSRHCCRVYKRL